MNNPIKYFLFVSVVGIIFYSIYSPLSLSNNDHMEIIEDNSSIEDYQAKNYCEKKIGEIKNKKIISLLKKTHRANIELASGSTYLAIYIYEDSDGPLKYHQLIGYDTRNKDAEKLIDFLIEECSQSEP